MASDQEHPLKKRRKKKAPVAVEKPSEEDKVFAWRRSEFRRNLGDSVSDADVELLATSSADLHRAEGMSEEGCPPDLLIRILAPL